MRKPLLLVMYRNQVFLYFHFNLRTKKFQKKQKFCTFFLNMTWSIEMKCNTVFMFNACYYYCFFYSQKELGFYKSYLHLFFFKKKISLAFQKKNVWKLSTPSGTLARQNEKLARHLVRWYTKLNSWHAFGTFTDTFTHGHVDQAGTHSTYDMQFSKLIRFVKV